MKSLKTYHTEVLRNLRGYKRRHKTTWIKNPLTRKDIKTLHFTDSVRHFYAYFGPVTFAKKYPWLFKQLEALGFEWERKAA